MHVDSFPGSSDGKESACNAGDLGSIPGFGRSPRGGKGYPLQCSGLENSMDCIAHGVAKSPTRLNNFQFISFHFWASLVAQTVKNLPAMRETGVQSLGLEDPLEEGMATHSSILAWRIPMDRGPWWATVHEVAKESDTTEQLSTQPGQKCRAKIPSLRSLQLWNSLSLWNCIFKKICLWEVDSLLSLDIFSNGSRLRHGLPS